MPDTSLPKLSRTSTMLNSPTRLTTRRPSPTTVSFTASNAPLRASLSARVIFYLTILLRVLLGVSVLLITASKASNSPPFHRIRAHRAISLEGSNARFTVFIAERISWRILIPSALAIIYIVFRRGYTGKVFNLFALENETWRHPSHIHPLYCPRKISNLPQTEESLLVLRGLGIQTSTSSPTYLSTSTTRFIPTDQIQDIFIHEAFKGFEVRFYLAVIVEGEGEVVVVFPVSVHRSPFLSQSKDGQGEEVIMGSVLMDTQKLLPKRKIVEEVWEGARACRYEPKS